MKRSVIIGLWVAIGTAAAYGIGPQGPTVSACAGSLWAYIPSWIFMMSTVAKWGALLHLGFSGELE